MDNASSLPLDSTIIGLGTEQQDRGHRRIRDIRFAELAYRSLQEASKWLERVAPVEWPERPDTLLKKHAPVLAQPEDAIRILREEAPRRFFAGVAQSATPAALTARLPKYRNDLILHADELLKLHFDLLAYRTLWFGDPIDWHLDPLRSRRAPLVAWSLIDVHDTATLGDNRLIWELNRHQWLVSLAQAWTLTGNDEYATACVRRIDAWLDANPPGMGINWASNAEVALRAISWCWVLLLLRDAPAVSGEWLTRVLAGIWTHATHVRRYLSYYCSTNTDLTSEALGLYYMATVFPEFRDADRWREVALRILTAECHEQVCRDGVHFERSTCYHRYATDTYLHFILLAQRNGVEINDAMVHRLQQMIDFLLAIRQPEGTLPALGDDDGGCLLPLQRRSQGDARGSFAVAAARFGRRDFAWAANGLAAEVLWLLGADGMRAFDALPAAPPAAAPSSVFPSGGYASMRSDWSSDAHHAIVDIGPIGCPVSGGHGHADLLSIQCSIFGEPCLVDPGTYCYTCDPPWRDYFRSTAAHSTVIVDGASQAEPSGPFGWHGQPRVKLREWHSTPEFDFLDAEHDGYRSLADPVTHRRRVIFVKPGYWILVDDVTGAARHQLDLTFQFASLNVRLGTHPWARAETPKGRVLWICPFPSAPVQPVLRCGEVSPISGWISDGYGARRAAPMLIYSFAVSLPWRIVTLLLPDRQGLASPPAVRAIYDDAGQPTGIAFDRPRRVVRFNDRALSVERE
jgi:uncharacterized heparinase superfamily protein